jgi:hypothetical protein
MFSGYFEHGKHEFELVRNDWIIRFRDMDL